MAMDLGNSGGSGRSRRVEADINITPLIDVVLVLLIIFMVLIPVSIKQLTATVPRKAESPTRAEGTQLVLRIGPRGELALDGQPLARADLPETVRRRLALASDKVVFFEVADEIGYGDMVHLMDLVKGLGARRLAIVTRD
jgi:biopolymer transport protein ExbD